MNSLDQRRKQVAVEIELLSRQVEEIDGKIRAYLADRQNKPHPRHVDLIEKIQGYRVDPSISTKLLVTMLDNLQWKVYYNKRAWKQLWDNAEAQRRKEKSNTAPYTESGSADNDEDMVHSKAQYSVDTLWEIQKEKLRVYGYSEVKETKTAFKKRMIQEYKKLSQDKNETQEIILIFDKDSKHCKLDIK
ncbi:MAG: hypothetical protein HF978_10925 [Desulfobacteraceae bacterium]|nr:hypothetical protein [Desulfobacteraceae bacterium]MBC2756049.1 hypothetical protein [Desulfobacteraceae bacterium]